MASKKTAAGAAAGKTAAKAPAKKIAATKATAKDSGKKAAPAKGAASARAAKTPAKRAAKGAAGKTSAKASGKKAPAKKATSSGKDYTKPELREKLKKQVIAGDKGGRPGQWSARKAQLLAHEYAAEGGGYTHPRNAAQTSLKEWGDEKWHTEDGEKAVQGEETHRYLPDAAWKELSPEERAKTDAKKVKGSKGGKQFVANTPAASKARKRATEHEG